MTREPQWRFRVCIQGAAGSSQFVSRFPHAASRAEELATGKRTRLLLVEDDIPTLLADYREKPWVTKGRHTDACSHLLRRTSRAPPPAQPR